MIDLDASNWINLGLLIVTAIVGLLSWLAASSSARKAHKDQVAANSAAERSASAAEQANSIQKRLVEIEEVKQQDATIDATRAVLQARIDRQQKLNSYGRVSDLWYLIVHNKGQAPARNLTVNIEGISIDDHKSVMSRQPVAMMVIGPGTDLRFVLAVTLSWAPPLECELGWDDDSSVRGGKATFFL